MVKAAAGFVVLMLLAGGMFGGLDYFLVAMVLLLGLIGVFIGWLNGADPDPQRDWLLDKVIKFEFMVALWHAKRKRNK